MLVHQEHIAYAHRASTTMNCSSSAAKLLLLITTSCILLVITPAALQLQEPANDNTVSATTTTCIPRERDALLAFKRSITGDPSGFLDSWQRGAAGHQEEQDCCRWRGVGCSNSTGHVLQLRLGNENPAYYYYNNNKTTAMVGNISSSLLALEYLEHLDLSNNNLVGSSRRIPEFLGSLKNLRYLNLSGIQFVGEVPPQLGNLSQLQYLDLSYMTSAKSTDISWLTRLPSLHYLNLANVHLGTVLDWPHIMNMIPSLRVLDLSTCSLTSANQSLVRLNFTDLEELDLSGNGFDHPVASCWFWNITRLKYLNLASTGLDGPFPDALGEMESLQALDFSYYSGTGKRSMAVDLNSLCNLEILNLGTSSLDGDVTELFKSLPRCSPAKLQELHLAQNNITGTLPNWRGKLTSLVVLDLSWNRITGPLPASLGQFTSLRTLDLSSNQFIGHVPSEIGMLANLTKLCLNNNGLDGVITEDHFASTQNLQYIDLSYNTLKIDLSSDWQPLFRLHIAYFASCEMGPLFPPWLQWQVDIYYLDISSAGIADRLPQWFSSAFSKFVFLNLSNNQLIGDLPNNMDIMSLEGLYLGSNQLTGQIPSLPPNLTFLDISMNSLSGPLPSDIGVPELGELSLFSNLITGRIPKSICNSKGLAILDLANNFLDGEFPRCLGMTQMVFLDLSNNSFSGEFPAFVQNCTYMKFIDLSGNRFSGRLPVWLGNLISLRLLRLSHNKFFGNLPGNITNLVCLQYLDLTNNGISGSLPNNMSNFKAMRTTYLEGNFYTHIEFCFDGDLQVFYLVNLFAVIKGQDLNYGSIHRVFNMNMISIDLSSNYLSGEIPEEMVILDALVNLNISRNYFSGNIPKKIGVMQSVESLDFSRNKLSGEIPVNLSNLAFLSYLDLSYNNLTGRIPSGTQLDTLYEEYPTMYTGNDGLCGPPLKKNCSSVLVPSRQTDEGNAQESSYLVGVGCGFTVGISVVFCVLLKKSWRISYFHLFQKV